VLSRDATTLFIAGNGLNSVFSLSSDDQWVSAVLRATANANCPKSQPSALALVLDKDVVCYCTNGFGPAPYPLTVLTDAAGNLACLRKYIDRDYSCLHSSLSLIHLKYK
jgi:hypothetical protein